MQVRMPKFALFLLGMGASVAVHAASITGISISPSVARVGEEVRITITGDSSDSNNCGIRLQFGDVIPTESFNLADRGNLPLTIVKTFNRPGTVKVDALGRKAGPLTFGCNGEASTTLRVVAGSAVAPATGAVGTGVVGGVVGGPPPAECPPGWQMIAGQNNPERGFTCAPLRPAQPLVCGPGLVYYEKDGLMGCKRKR